MFVLLVSYLITGLRSSVDRVTLIKDNSLLSSTSYKSLKMVTNTLHNYLIWHEVFSLLSVKMFNGKIKMQTVIQY